jgi:hypothetical protein
MATRGRPRKTGSLVKDLRRQMSVMPVTMERLNRFKVRLSERMNRPVSQDDAVATLLDLAEAVDGETAQVQP